MNNNVEVSRALPVSSLLPCSLRELCLECLASNTSFLVSLGHVPEECIVPLFERILQKGKLTPRVLEVFERAESDAVKGRIAQLHIKKWIPPLIKDDNEWPGKRIWRW